MREYCSHAESVCLPTLRPSATPPQITCLRDYRGRCAFYSSACFVPSLKHRGMVALFCFHESTMGTTARGISPMLWPYGPRYVEAVSNVVNAGG